MHQSVWPPFAGRLWQRNYHEHIVRDDADLARIRQYITENPARWAEDSDNPQSVRGGPPWPPWASKAMIADLKPYPAYKDSGVPWLGEVPGHWEARRNGRLFAQRNETGFADLPILEVSLKTGVRVREFAASNRKQVMADRDKYKRAAKGDIAYNMMRMWQGAVGVAPIDGLVSPAYVVARPHAQTVTGYFGYLFRVGAYMDEVNNYSRGIVSDRNRLYWDEFKQMPSLFPSPVDDTIKQFAQVGATVGHAEHSGDLRKFIESGKKVIISTVQKFPLILDEISSEHRSRCFAIIIDEAHSSQGGRTSAAISLALSEAGAEEDDETIEDKINQSIVSWRQRSCCIITDR